MKCRGCGAECVWLVCAGSQNNGSFNTASGQTGSYISPNGTVTVYPVQPVTATQTPSPPAPTLSSVLASVFGTPATPTTPSTFVPVTSTTSLGAIVNGLLGTGR